ncbi:hypothetical protein SmJEL517_g01923 [Synchytrium microbalum]|uniref:Uncharacterized protein n=1 Tax=Synchytrium microbalum TaxID=1806994 RepID=A0A507C8L2_9FUNG|nr:uncharacterized protein SmJEL517_g01923 [Synchytrium microbalum]TPX35668.1 hypothetical protein SmJEL517_g01923 [Synchytrium microbalum]
MQYRDALMKIPASHNNAQNVQACHENVACHRYQESGTCLANTASDLNRSTVSLHSNPMYVLEHLLSGDCSMFIGHAVNCVNAWNQQLQRTYGRATYSGYPPSPSPTTLPLPSHLQQQQYQGAAVQPSYILHAAFHSITHSQSRSAAVLVFLTTMLYSSTRIPFPKTASETSEFYSIAADMTGLDLFITGASTASKFLFDADSVASMSKFWESISSGMPRQPGWLNDLERRYMNLIQWNLNVSPTELYDWTVSIIQVVRSGTVVPVVFPSLGANIVVVPRHKSTGKRSHEQLLTPAELCGGDWEGQVKKPSVKQGYSEQQQQVWRQQPIGLLHVYEPMFTGLNKGPSGFAQQPPLTTVFI